MYEWQNPGIPEVIEIFGYRIEPVAGGWTLVVFPLIAIFAAAGIIRWVFGKEEFKPPPRQDGTP